MTETFKQIRLLAKNLLLARRRYCRLAFIAVASLTISAYSYAQPGKLVYQNYCGGCHGAQLQGSVASPLIKKAWKYGGDRNSILRTIRNGIPETTMARWEGTLSAKESERGRAGN